jgi:hypothetical protein
VRDAKLVGKPPSEAAATLPEDLDFHFGDRPRFAELHDLIRFHIQLIRLQPKPLSPFLRHAIQSGD